MPNRRRFLQIGGIALVGAASAACPGGTFSVRMRFNGLFALVTSDAVDRAEILFLSPARSGDPSVGKHLPRLKIHLEHVVKPDPDLLDPIDPDVGIWYLDDCHVGFPALSGATTAATTTIQSLCPSGGDWSNLRWIADLRTVIDKDAVVDPTCVEEGDLRATPVATRIPLAGGSIQGAQPTVTAYRTEWFTFGHTKTAVTDMVQFVADPVTAFSITRKPFDPARSGSTPDIVLKAPTEASRPIYLFLQNLMDPDAEGAPLDNQCPHFTRLYDFIDRDYSDDKRCFPNGPQKCAGGSPDSPVYCPPARLYYKS